MNTYKLQHRYLNTYLTFYYKYIPKCPTWDKEIIKIDATEELAGDEVEKLQQYAII